jgi:hypothetical protein
MPASFSFNFYRGDSYKYRFKLWQDAAKTIPYVLSAVNDSVAAEIRDKPGGSNITVLIATIVEPNFVDIEVTSEMTKTMVTKGEWDLEITFLDGDVYTPIRGPVSVAADITGSTPP